MPLKLSKRCGVWQITGTELGIRVRRSTGIEIAGKDNRAQAEEALHAAREDIRKKRKSALGGDEVIKIGFLVDHYLSDKDPRTAEVTRRIFSWFGDDATIADAIDLIDNYRLEMHKRQLSPGTIVNYLANLKAVFNHARARGWTDREITIDKPRVSLEVKSLSEDEVDALIAHADPWIRPHLIFLRNTGLRSGELLSLRREDVDLSTRRAIIRDTKNGEDRIIPLNAAAIQVIKDLPWDGILFRDADGQPFPYSKQKGGSFLNRPVARAAKAAGIRHVTPHMLRHTFATRLVEAGASMEVLKKLGGWKSINMAARYGNADLRVQDKYATMISNNFNTSSTTNDLTEE
jgi:integrase